MKLKQWEGHAPHQNGWESSYRNTLSWRAHRSYTWFGLGWAKYGVVGSITLLRPMHWTPIHVFGCIHLPMRINQKMIDQQKRRPTNTSKALGESGAKTHCSAFPPYVIPGILMSIRIWPPQMPSVTQISKPSLCTPVDLYLYSNHQRVDLPLLFPIGIYLAINCIAVLHLWCSCRSFHHALEGVGRHYASATPSNRMTETGAQYLHPRATITTYAQCNLSPT